MENSAKSLSAVANEVQQAPQDSVKRFEYSKLLAEQGDFERALVEIDLAISLKDRVIDFHRHRLAVLKGLGQYHEAIESAKAVVGLAPNNAYANFNLAELLVKADSLSEAIPCIEKAIEIDAGVAAFHHLYSSILGRLGKLVEAAAAERLAVAVAPDNAYMKARLSDLLAKLGQIDEALPLIDEAISLQGGEPYFYINRSVVLELLGHVELAIVSARTGVEMKLKDPYFKARLSHLLALTGKTSEALALIEQSIAIDGKVVSFKKHRDALLGKLEQEAQSPVGGDISNAAAQPNPESALNFVAPARLLLVPGERKGIKQRPGFFARLFGLS